MIRREDQGGGTMIATFFDVGRGKATFSVELKRLDFSELMRAVRPHLRSSDVEFMLPEGEEMGSVMVGFGRVVGRFTVDDKEAGR